MISVITPTYGNWAELQNCISSLEAQTFTGWQHVIVHDGPNPDVRDNLRSRGYDTFGKRVFIELGRNWHGFMGGDSHPVLPGHPGSRGGRGSRGAAVALFATHLASGKYVTYLDADCVYAPTHLEGANKVLQETGADFVYTQMLRELDGRPWDIIGDGNPRYGAIDCNAVVHSAKLLVEANWRWGGDADWDLLSRFLANGASYAYIPEATIVWRHASNDV